MLDGIVIKSYNSFYYVQTAEHVVMCTLRGRFKKERFSLLVGDQVEYETTGVGKGIIENILPRRSMLRRPMIANIDQVILTFAAVKPNINPILVDRFLVLAEMSSLDIILCINKIDLADRDELETLVEHYRSIGYQVLTVSAKEDIGIHEIRSRLHGKISVFAGPSGAGKSTLLNHIETGLTLVTGELSEKIGRGKHTTRFAELLPLAGGGFVVDTPGFSFTEFGDVKQTELMYYFPEIAERVSECKFSTCVHWREPQCAVKQAVTAGLITEQRYKSYLEILEEIFANKKGVLANMIKIAPSILAADFSKLAAEINKVEVGGADMIHIDIMDGHFVPNLTFGPPVVAAIRPVTKLLFDVHLMVNNPQDFIEPFAKAGANLLTIHVETTPHLHRVIQQVKELGLQVGVALNPSTPLSTIEEVLADVDMVLLMTVNPGFGGQKFIPQMLDKITRLKNMITTRNLQVDIQVDGGINASTARQVVAAGANVLVAGSAVYGASDIGQAIREIRGT